MTPVSTNIKIDPELKEQAQDLFESLGMNLTTAVPSASGSLRPMQKHGRPFGMPATALG